ncbi:hypothetical protein GpartN1_g689.t1 [Galdieria partita]|uniref:Uncharacterized protein n=1 Tax=Galdieria partita TaxID=83374 RepID=A0A9C7PQK1_9RHOD|nr:hypothetical protein GpartN1_g689.t1 [Galdieria partita]
MPPKGQQKKNYPNYKICPISKNTVGKTWSTSKKLCNTKNQVKNAISYRGDGTQTASTFLKAVKKTSYSKLGDKEKSTNVQNVWQYNGEEVKTSYILEQYQKNACSSSKNSRNETRVYKLNHGKRGGMKLEKTQHETEEIQELVCYR